MQTVLTLAGAAALTSVAHAQTYWVTFDPARGTLPSEQCWDLNRSSGMPLPTLGLDGVTIGPSTYGGTLYYSREASVNFARGAVMEADVFVIDSAYRTNPCGAGQRAGIVLSMVDVSRKRLVVGIGNQQVYMSALDNSVVGPSAPVATVQFQGVWRHLRLEVASGVATLLVDGVPTLSTTVGALSTVSRRVSFGDGSVCGEGHAKFGLVRFLADEDCSADFNRDGFTDFFSTPMTLSPASPTGLARATRRRTSTGTGLWTSSTSMTSSSPSRPAADGVVGAPVYLTSSASLH